MHFILVQLHPATAAARYARDVWAIRGKPLGPANWHAPTTDGFSGYISSTKLRTRSTVARVLEDSLGISKQMTELCLLNQILTINEKCIK